jgi:hypothetical protein
MQIFYELLYLHPFLALLQTALTVWMLIDAYRRPAEGFWMWVILLVQPFGAWIYLFVVKIRDFNTPQGWSLWQRGPSLAELRYRAEKTPTLASHLALAQRLIERHEYEQAIPHLESAAEIELDHGQVLYSLALCHARCEQPSKAVPLLERLVTKDPRWSHYRAWYLLIETRTLLNDSAGAVAGCRELVRLSSTMQHQCLLAEHLILAQQPLEAQTLLDQSLRDYSFAPGPIRWRNRRWAGQARRMLRRIGA